MRNSIFDIVTKNIDMASDTRRLITLFEDERLVSCIENVKIGIKQEKRYVDYTLYRFINFYCFNNWKGRGRCIALQDFLDTLRYELIKSQSVRYIDSFISLIELIYNMWNLAGLFITENPLVAPIGNFLHLKNLMDDILKQYNHTVYFDKQTECTYVIEDKPEVTAACEIVPQNLSLDIIKYNHRTLKGNIELKKQILVNLGAEIEPQRSYLKSINNKLEDYIFFALNNLNIRHNNRQEGSKSYNEHVSNMSNDELEEWYDELYQMILLAMLFIDNKSRSEKFKQLKIDITGEHKNGQT